MTWSPEVLRALPAPTAALRSQYAALAARIEGTRGALAPTALTYFWNADYLLQRRPRYAVALRLVSSRTLNSECVANENMRGLHLGTGATFVHLLAEAVNGTAETGSGYFGAQPLWDWTALPGTTTERDGVATCLERPRVASFPPTNASCWVNCNETQVRSFVCSVLHFFCLLILYSFVYSRHETQWSGESDFVGAATGGARGVAAFSFRSPTRASPQRVQFNRSWFFFSRFFVVLTTDLEAERSSRFALATALAQRRLSGAARLGCIGGGAPIAPSPAPRSARVAANASCWAWHDSIGYTILENEDEAEDEEDSAGEGGRGGERSWRRRGREAAADGASRVVVVRAGAVRDASWSTIGVDNGTAVGALFQLSVEHSAPTAAPEPTEPRARARARARPARAHSLGIVVEPAVAFAEFDPARYANGTSAALERRTRGVDGARVHAVLSTEDAAMGAVFYEAGVVHFGSAGGGARGRIDAGGSAALPANGAGPSLTDGVRVRAAQPCALLLTARADDLSPRVSEFTVALSDPTQLLRALDVSVEVGGQPLQCGANAATATARDDLRVVMPTGDEAGSTVILRCHLRRDLQPLK